jgi:ADP-ribose pyrophosphatase YjhB (NUDIX family)
MINDQPIAHTVDGRPLFDNTPTVVAMLVYDGAQLAVIRRANEPGRGLIGLPGGYHMRGEKWQEAGAREVKEEIGVIIDPQRIVLQSLQTDKYGNNLVIARAPLERFVEGFQLDPNEVQEVLWINDAGFGDDWAFPLHFLAAARYFLGERK